MPNPGFNSDSGLHVGCLSPFTANVWWFSPRGFLPPSEGLKIVPVGTISQGRLAWPELVLDEVKSMALPLPFMSIRATYGQTSLGLVRQSQSESQPFRSESQPFRSKVDLEHEKSAE